MHYGKISEYYTTEQNWKDRAEWDMYENDSNYNATLNNHRISNAEDTLQLKKVNEEWLWK